MQTVNDEIKELYGGFVRVRVCGICISDGKILLVNHSLYSKNGFFWAPPGGGIQFGESAVEALQREFREETGLTVEVGELLFVNEHIQAPLHAVELFFEIRSFQGVLSKGNDPEISNSGQIIEEVKFMGWNDIREFDSDQVHSVFSRLASLEGFRKLGKYISGVNNHF
ncbi:NUDIX domain-containing protein [Dyadobacter sp. CY323]|uniref:NUDIX domain-containing protein n=1 Tax=Dyadobacter sp. CY323 TaxID=2907302 RepID=UPI001F234F7B|nr:NUDIX domain-containing protein [Dyadobacter sp. CY323]MCE6987701.1 NUDIX domain-containing protein [Dyadobacter sp. CY323]